MARPVKHCDCGQPIYTFGKRCRKCQEIHRATRAALPRKFPLPVRDPDPKRNHEHLEWIASLPCTVPGCRLKSVAAHVRMNTGGGMGLKPGDNWTVPLCGQKHHLEQHAIGHDAFDAKYGLDLRAEAEFLAQASPYIRNADL